MDRPDTSATRQHAVPHFAPLDGAGDLPVPSAHPTRRSRQSAAVKLPYGDDQWEHRLLVAALVIAVLVVIALVLVSR